MSDLWPWLVLAAWCWGFCAGIAWAAQWRPTRIEIVTRTEAARDD
jgi:hypothetical protein